MAFDRKFSRPRQLSGAHVLYRDIVDYREAEADVAADVRTTPLLWQPEDIREPSDALAVIGILTVYAITGRMDRVSWSGEAVHGYASLTDDIINDIEAVFDADDAHVSLISNNKLAIRLPIEGCRYWSGQITGEKIWQSCHTCLRDAYARQNIDGAKVSMDYAYGGVKPPSATGYDNRAAGSGIDDGFSISAHPDIVLNGQRPAVEMYALIGAAQLLSWGRWPTRDTPRIPDMSGIALRDYIDLERFVWISPTLHTVTRMSGKRRILSRR